MNNEVQALIFRSSGYYFCELFSNELMAGIIGMNAVQQQNVHYLMIAPGIIPKQLPGIKEIYLFFPGQSFCYPPVFFKPPPVKTLILLPDRIGRKQDHMSSLR